MQSAPHSRTHLFMWLGHWTGALQSTERFVAADRPAPGPSRSEPLASYGYLGDIKVHFVFDAPRAATDFATKSDLSALDLDPEHALVLALVNQRRVYGAPRAVLLETGISSIQCETQEIASGYLLDRLFWNSLLEKHPQGLLAAVPRPEVVLFVPADDAQGEKVLSESVSRIAAKAGERQVSLHVFQFTAQGWQLFKPLPNMVQGSEDTPAAEAIVSASVIATGKAGGHGAAPSPASLIVPPGPEAEQDLGEVAAGQKLMIRSIVGTVLANAAARGSALGTKPLLFLYVVLAICCFAGIWRLCSGLGKKTATTFGLLVLNFVPPVNLVVCAVLSIQATRTLRAAGWKVGLLGSRQAG